jgi:hypothetical protein
MRSSVAVLAWLLLLPGWAAAHPVDEVVQAAYLTLALGEVRVELDLTPGIAVADAVLWSLDANADQRIDAMEARSYAQRVLQQSTLTLDGVTTPLRLEKIIVPPYPELKSQGGTLKIYAVAGRTDRAGGHTLSYGNHYEPAKCQCIANVFLQPAAGWRYQVARAQHSDDGRLLLVAYTGAASKSGLVRAGAVQQ